jgi:hypothetical protein
MTHMQEDALSSHLSLAGHESYHTCSASSLKRQFSPLTSSSPFFQIFFFFM